MLMKVFNKGQIVIPAEIRREFGIEIGGMLDVVINRGKQTLEIKKSTYHADALAGSLSEYSVKPFPSNKQINESLASGLSHEK